MAIILLTSGNEDLSKDQWTQKTRNTFLKAGCADLINIPEGKKILQSKNMNLEQCNVVVGNIFNKCLEKYYNDIPPTVNSLTGSDLARKIGACMDQDMAKYFNTDFFLPKKATKNN